MTKEELATQITGREIGNELLPNEERKAKQSGLLVIFGASDDLCELRGVINDEVGTCGGATVSISRDGLLLKPIEDDDKEILEQYGVLDAAIQRRKVAITVDVRWVYDKSGPAWTYATSEPHSTFDVMEDGEVWCRGIILQVPVVNA